MAENLVWSGTNYNGIDYKLVTDGNLNDILIDNGEYFIIPSEPGIPDIYNSAIYNGGSGVGWRGVIITKTPMTFRQYYYWGGSWREETSYVFNCTRQNNTAYERDNRNVVTGFNIYENFGIGTNGTTTYSYLPQFNEGEESTFRSYVSTPVSSTYNWVSVSTITGKNGTFALSTINSSYINNGDPVTGATISNFDALEEETNVGTLVNDSSIDETKVVVRYNIPQGTYLYTKLVYKLNSEPETISDGVAIDLNQVDSQYVIDSIITAGTYYFKIFTNVGNSNTVVLNYVGIVPIIINIERVW